MIARLLAIGLGLALAAAAGWLLLDRLGPDSAPPITLRDGRADMAELQQELGVGNVAGIGSRRGRGGHILLNHPIAERLFGIKERGLFYDPLAYFRRPAFQRLAFKWAEHPAGGWRLHTNSLGLREDEELAPERPELRIFVTGDSHTDGVCENPESYANLLEADLRADGQDAEVNNAGVAGYSFYNYLGALDRFTEFGVDAYVVGVYGGNDFLGVLGPHRFFAGEPIPLPEPNGPRIGKAANIKAAALSQGFFAYDHFAQHPEDIDLAVTAGVDTTLALQGNCEGLGTRLIVVYIPPVYDVDPELVQDDLTAIQEVLELTDEQLRCTDRQADAYLAAIEEAGVEVLDMRPHFRAAKEPLYWQLDHHINLAGHRLIADELLKRFP
ncbi:MAG: SGNH/GDSL hydrolase family protein [Planctomycetota bacterium]|nr:SGNH/GDSL hydrolase family protein [Planctomycetota bacterium]